MNANAGPGEVIGGRYTVLKVLGQGGFGVVYLVKAHHDEREYALKTSLRDFSDRRAMARFRQEADVWVALGAHPFLVQAYFVDEVEGRLFIGMECVRPGASGLNDLAGYLSVQPPGLEQILRWGIELSHGMEFAASRGVRSHRDLKPANVMIDPDGHVKITDFGLASQPGRYEEPGQVGTIDSSAEPDFKGQTMRGIGFGTPIYMPPEQFEDAAACDERTDIYATGVMLYQMVTGSPPVIAPFPQANTLEARLTFWKDMEEAHRSFQMPHIDHPLNSVLARCLETNPEHRYPGFGDLRQDLTRLMQQVGGRPVVSPATPPPTPRERVNRAISLQRLERLEDALSEFENALSENDTLASAWNGVGVCLARLGRHEEALRACDRVLVLEPDNAKARTNRATCLQALGRHHDALAEFESALRLDPSQAGAWSNKGNLQFQAGDIRGAIKSYQRSLGLDPTRANSHANRGHILASIGEFDDALASFDAALARSPSLPFALQGRAGCRVHLGSYELARTDYLTLEKQKSLSPAGWLGQGFACLYLLRLAESQRAFLRAGETEAVRAEARVGLALVYFHLNRFGLAVAELREVGSTSDRPDLMRLQAVLLHFDAKYHEAISVSSSLLEQDSEDRIAATNLACSQIAVRQFDAAAEVLKPHVSGKSAGDILYNRGVALAMSGRIAEAIAQFEAVLEHEPYMTKAWHNLGVCHDASGRTADALSAFAWAWEYERSHAAYWNSGRDGDVPDIILVPDRQTAVEPVVNLRRSQSASAETALERFLRPPSLHLARYVPSMLT